MLGTTQRPILQIHPSLRCNLSCLHCYSNSGPTASLGLDINTVYDTINNAAQMGYEIISFSGGEPFMYKHLSQALEYAKQLGLQTTVTTNGFFLEEKLLTKFIGKIDTLAISVDGPPDLHNRLRQSDKAFERLTSGIKVAHELNFNFGFIHTLTRLTWEHMLWLVDFALENGAKLLQMHPLEAAGRGTGIINRDGLDQEMLARVYLLSFILAAKYDNQLVIQLDALHKDVVANHPELVYALNETIAETSLKPAHLLGLLVLEADGSVVPLSYGFSRQYQICNVHQQSLQSAWTHFQQTTYPMFRDLCNSTFAEICQSNEELPIFNWHEFITAKSHQLAPVI